MKKLFAFLIGILVTAQSFAAGHTVTITPSTMVTCNGMCDGSATASVSGGVGPFVYLWNDPAGQTSSTATSLCAGSYTVTVTDVSDASTATATINITEPPLLTIGMPSSYFVCNGACVALSPMAIGGTPAYTFSWSPATGLSSVTLAAPTSCPSATTTYTIIATDSYGCTATASTTVTVNPPLAAITTSTNTTSCTLCNGTATVTPTGGAGGPYVYLWNTGLTTANVVGLCPGSDTITVTDMNGCTTMATATISNTNPVQSNYTMVPDSTSGLNYWAFNTSTGDSLSYIWYFGDGDSSFVQSPMHTYAAPGIYNVCLIVSTPGNCFDVKCTVLNVASSTAASCLALFNIADDTTSTDPNTYTVYNLSYGSTLTYAWDFGDGSTSNLQNPTHVYSTTGSYQICLIVDNGGGCNQTFCDSLMWVDSLGLQGQALDRSTGNPLSVTVLDMPFPIVSGINELIYNTDVSVSPNPFTTNTTFVIESNKSETYSFELFDVLGKSVRTMKGISKKQFTMNRENLQEGIYFYKISTIEGVIGVGKVIVK